MEMCVTKLSICEVKLCLIMALSWGDWRGAHSIVRMMITWNYGIKAAKALFFF